ncbi:MAG: T9SS type A sorting domain-containing protein [Flavobacteriales bacterium]|nr:T9SS type A sorting domain-containing protein [Flavobacteriales bacterium]
MKRKLYLLSALMTVATSVLNAQMPTNGLIFENHFNGTFAATIPTNAVIFEDQSYNYQLGPDASDASDQALSLIAAEGYPSLIYNNVVNGIRPTNSNGNGITYYFNARLDSAFLQDTPVNSYIGILQNGQQFIRILKTGQTNPYTIQWGVLDGNTETGTYGYSVTAQTTQLSELIKWKGYAFTYEGNSTSGEIKGYFGNFVGNSYSASSTTGLSFGVADTLLYLGKNGGNMPFVGSMDDVLIYERALSGDEIRSINTLYGVANVEDKKELELVLYPNPATNQLKVKTNKEVAYTINSITGASVKKGALGINQSIAIDDLENGHYFITLFQENSSQTIPFVKH